MVQRERGRERGGREGERREGGREALILQHKEVSQLMLMLVNFILSIACHKFHGKFKQLCGVRRQHVVGRLTLAILLSANHQVRFTVMTKYPWSLCIVICADWAGKVKSCDKKKRFSRQRAATIKSNQLC